MFFIRTSPVQVFPIHAYSILIAYSLHLHPFTWILVVGCYLHPFTWILAVGCLHWGTYRVFMFMCKCKCESVSVQVYVSQCHCSSASAEVSVCECECRSVSVQEIFRKNPSQCFREKKGKKEERSTQKTEGCQTRKAKRTFASYQRQKQNKTT